MDAAAVVPADAPAERPDGAAVIRRLLAEARAKSADLSISLHPAWVRRGLQRVGLPAAVAGQPPRRWSAALAALYELKWPALDRFTLVAHRIALLPCDELRRVLAAVALHGERQRVRLCIGRDRRALLLERLGRAAYEQMLEAPPLNSGTVAALTAQELDADRLATIGLDRLIAGGQWHDERLLGWARLAIAPAEPAQARRARPRTPPGPDLHDLLNRLPSYFPEHAWLFGSITDRALSVSTTA